MAKSKARTWKSDVAHNMTEKELGKLQTRIEAVFDECSNEMMETANDYFGKLAPRIDKMQKELKNGNITNEQYQSWMRAQIGRGNQFYKMRDKLASYSADASTYAHDLISKSLPTTYAINRNYAAYQIDTMTGIDFNLWDEHTVNRLLVEKPDLMPHYPIMRAIDREINLAYGKTKITDVVTSGILQGWSIDQMAKRMVSDVVGMSKVSAVRAARTATTSAENAGRMDEFLEAESIGIDCEKEWMATLDGRTRHTHGKLDGVHVPLKEKFDNGLMYPAEPSGHPSEVYNCRCTLAPYFGQLDKKYGGRRKTYSEWVKEKENNGEKITIKSKASYQEIKDMMAKSATDAEAKKKRNVAPKATKSDVPTFTTILDKSHTRESLEADKVTRNPVKMLKDKLTSEQIIQRLAGGDRTTGSCASLALAYTGNRHGFDVLDFRGGNSQRTFSRWLYLEEITKLGKVSSVMETGYNDIKNAKNLMATMQQGKEYILITGKHASVVRKVETGYEYLEMQSASIGAYTNGWHNFDKYGSIDKTLRGRFGCTASRSIYGTKMEQRSILADIDSFDDNSEFYELLSYINTDADKQMKGTNGQIR